MGSPLRGKKEKQLAQKNIYINYIFNFFITNEPFKKYDVQ